MRARTVQELVAAHEGLRLKPYKDSLGVLTIGYGRNLDDVGLRRNEAEIMLGNELRAARVSAQRYRWFADLSDVRQAVIVDMHFQLGRAGFAAFTNTRAAIAAGDWHTAADEMSASRWHEQTPTRCERLARMMVEDRWPDA